VGSSSLGRRSDWGRPETRHSDKGGGQGGGQFQASRSMQLTRSMDRSSHMMAVEPRWLSFASVPSALPGQPGPRQSPADRTLLGGLNSAAAAAIHSQLDLNMLSLQHLAAGGSSKRSRLAQTKNIRKPGTACIDSAGSGGCSRLGVADRIDSARGLERCGTAAAAAAGTSSTRTSFRQMSCSLRSEPDLGRVSTSSSVASGAPSATPTPSLYSCGDGRGTHDLSDCDAAAGGVTSPDSSLDYARKLR